MWAAIRAAPSARSCDLPGDGRVTGAARTDPAPGGMTVAPGTGVEEAPDAQDPPLDGAVARATAVLAGMRSPGVAGDDPWPEAGRKVLRFHFARLLAHLPGAIAGEDPEEIHVMRVASRRMRAAWRVYGDGFDRVATRRYRADLRTTGAHLGAVRDLDVLLEIVDVHAGRHGSRAARGLVPLRVAWAAERRARHADLVGYLATPGFGDFVASHEAFLGADAADVGTVERLTAGRVRGRMPATAWAAYHDVWSFEERLAGADLATLHQLRIAGKWLRYTLESVREPLGGDAGALIEPVVSLQDHLGEQHDLHVAASLARAFSEKGAGLTPKEKAQTERFVRALDARVAWYGERLPRAWRPLVAARYRNRLGRALASL